MYHPQAPPNTYRLRPTSQQRGQSKQQQRRSVAVTSDLHRYYQPFSHPPSTISTSTSNQHRNSRPKLTQRPLNNVNSRPQPSAFPTISIEKSGTLSRQQKPTKTTVLEAENTTGSNAASHFLKWLRKRPPKPTSSQPPPQLHNRANWTSSLPRNFSIRLPPNAPNRPHVQKVKVIKGPIKQPTSSKQPISNKPTAPSRPSLNRLNHSDADGHYDNSPAFDSGYYNVKLGPSTTLTPSQEATAAKYATISRRNLPRYDPPTITRKSCFGTLPEPSPVSSSAASCHNNKWNPFSVEWTNFKYLH